MSDPTFADLVEQARQRLTLTAGLIEENDGTFDGYYPPDEPVSERLVIETVQHVAKLREQIAGEDLNVEVRPDWYVNEDGNQQSLTWDTASPEVLRRFAAHAIVSYSLLRREAEQQMVNIIAALDRADVLARETKGGGADVMAGRDVGADGGPNAEG
jgi:hypothetical protein